MHKRSLLFAAGALVFALNSSAAETVLGSLAESMPPGTWAAVPQTNINSVLGHGAHDGNILPYAMSAKWDATARRLHFLGGDHGETASWQVYYDEATNEWVDLGATNLSGFGGVHGYDHLALDKATRQLYFNPYGGSPGGTKIFRYSLESGGSWNDAGQYKPSEYVNVTHGVDWFDGPLNGAGPGGALTIYNCGAPRGEIAIYDAAANKWIAGVTGFGGESTYHCFIEYSKVHNVAILGGGNANGRKVWRLNSNRTVTAMSDAPVEVGIQRANVVADPVTGNFLVMGYGQLWEFDPRGAGAWSLQTESRTPPAEVGNPGFPNVNGVISAAISNYGVVAYTTCRAAACSVYLYKHAGAGTRITPPVTTSQPPPPSPTAPAPPPTRAPTAIAAATPAGSDEFQALCRRPGVLKCVGFDSAADLAGTWGDNSGTLPGDATPEIDPEVRHSGAGSLKFTIPSQSGANTSGSYFTNFSSDLAAQFDENSEFYVQWRQRFSPEFINTAYRGGGGWKQVIIGTGDKPGCSSSNVSALCYSSCSALETVVQNLYHRGFAQMYNSCTGSASHGPYEPFQQSFGSSDFKLQNARREPSCLYSQGSSNPSRYFPPAGNCFGYFPNEWMTFQVRIKTGPRVQDEFRNSFVQLSVAREGKPGEPVIEWGPYNLSAGDPKTDQKFGKIWLLPYNTGKDPAASYPAAYTWYDDLIISTQPIR